MKITIHDPWRDEPTTPEARVARAIFADITDRTGFRQAWDQCSPGVRMEMWEAWLEIGRKASEELTLGNPT